MGYNKRSNGFFNSLNIPRTIKAITQAHDTDSCSKSSRYVFNCPFCIHKTPKKSNLKIHIKRKHFRSALSVGGLDVCVARIRRCLNFDDEKVTSLSASFNSTKDLSSSTNNWNALSHSNEIENKDETEIGAGDKKQLCCPHCNYEAVTAYRLRLHINTHLQLRLFQCPVCDHRSNWSSNILKHLRRFHPTAPKNVVILSADNESKQKVDNLSYPQYKTSEESASVQLTEKEVSSPGKVKQENAEVPKYKADSVNFFLVPCFLFIDNRLIYYKMNYICVENLFSLVIEKKINISDISPANNFLSSIIHGCVVYAFEGLAS